jgi:signal transduction histidine kinase
LPRARYRALLVTVGVAYGAVLALQRGHALPFVRWQVIFLVTLGFAATVRRMVSRSWKLNDSERVARQRSEQIRSELETANTAKTAFLARMSHELRTPLNAIIGFSDVLAQRTFGPLAPKQAEYIGDIVDSGRHLLSLVDDLLDLPSVETGTLRLDVTTFALADVVRAALAVFHEETERRHLQVHVDVEANVPLMEGDERKLRQVVLNLLSNAVKFTPEGGTISIAAAASGIGVRLTVLDNGPGIPSREREAVFTEFHQTAVAGSGRGTGLGLPLARRFVELHGGHLWAEDEPHGARLVAWLPQHCAPPSPAVAPATERRREPLIFGEPDSEERRVETMWLALNIGAVASISAAIAITAVLLFPKAAHGAHPITFLLLSASVLGLIGGIWRRPNALASRGVFLWMTVYATAGLSLMTIALGRDWGQLTLPYLAFAASAAVLGFADVRVWATTFVILGAGEALALWGLDGTTVPAARWLGAMAYIVATAAIYQRFVARIQAQTEADEIARGEADRIALELAVASRHKSQFFADMSHELRTPLNAIIGFSEVLESEAFGPLNEKQLEYVGDVLVSGRHLLGLINDILDLAKAEAGRMGLRRTPFDADDLVGSVVRDFEALAAARRIALQLDADSVGVVEADEAKVRAAVTNLVSNAVKFAPSGGHVRVHASQSGGHFEVRVHDSGPGVAPEDVDRIFEAFTASGPDHGFGVGLALARRYAEMHAGTLTVASTPGEGAAFTLRLPMQAAQRAGYVSR